VRKRAHRWCENDPAGPLTPGVATDLRRAELAGMVMIFFRLSSYKRIFDVIQHQPWKAHRAVRD
jgi:hypothetical protein